MYLERYNMLNVYHRLSRRAIAPQTAAEARSGDNGMVQVLY